MDESDSGLLEKRVDSLESSPGLRFLLIGVQVALLVAASWGVHSLVGVINRRLFHADPTDARGWCFYLVGRLPFVVLLLWTIFGGPGSAANRGYRKERTAAKDRFDPLLALRAFACLLVLMGHFFLVVFFFEPAHLHPLPVALLRTSPWAGVWIFFTLSGFLMGKAFFTSRYSLDVHGMRSFIRNRFLRLLPVYGVSVLLTCLYRYPRIFEPHHWWMLLGILTFDYRGDFPISPNGALWSISTEMQFYFAAPFLALALLFLRRRVGPAAMSALPFLLLAAGECLRMGILHLLPGRFFSYGYSALVPNLDLFLLGMSLNLLPVSIRVPRSLRTRTGPALLIASIVFYVAISWFSRHALLDLERYWALAPLPCAIFAACFIFLAEQADPIIRKPGLSGHWLSLLQWMGVLTYCLYVFHPDVMLSLENLRHGNHQLATQLAWWPLVMTLVVAVAAFFYFTVERPFDRKKRVSGTELTDAP